MIEAAVNRFRAIDWSRVGKQIFREFWFPLLVALIWTFFFVSYSKSDFVSLIGNFSASFFLISWATGQFFRIVRHQDVEDSFKQVKEMLAPVVSAAKMQLEKSDLTPDARSLASAVVAADAQLTKTAELVRRQMDQVGGWFYNQWDGPPAARMTAAQLNANQATAGPVSPPPGSQPGP